MPGGVRPPGHGPPLRRARSALGTAGISPAYRTPRARAGGLIPLAPFSKEEGGNRPRQPFCEPLSLGEGQPGASRAG